MRYKLFLFGLVLVAGLLSGCGHKDEVRSLYERGKALRAEEKEEEAMYCFLIGYIQKRCIILLYPATRWLTGTR